MPKAYLILGNEIVSPAKRLRHRATYASDSDALNAALERTLAGLRAAGILLTGFRDKPAAAAGTSLALSRF